MPISLNIHTILSQVRQLDTKDQLTLLQRIAVLLKNDRTQNLNPPPLSTISGVGSELWKSAGAIDQYIDGERQW